MDLRIAGNPEQFMFLAERRLREAVQLLRAREWAGAFYLAGYVVECGIKAVAMLDGGRRLTDELRIHDIHRLAVRVRWRLTEADYNALAALPAWNHNVRYVCAPPSPTNAAAFINAAKEALRCLKNYLH